MTEIYGAQHRQLQQEFDKEKLSLMISLIETICNNKKFNFKWS